jgi:hypothetical protein
MSSEINASNGIRDNIEVKWEGSMKCATAIETAVAVTRNSKGRDRNLNISSLFIIS